MSDDDRPSDHPADDHPADDRPADGGPPLETPGPDTPAPGAPDTGPAGTDATGESTDATATSNGWRNLLHRAGRSKLVLCAWVIGWTLVLVPVLFSPTAQLGPGTVDASFRPSLQGRTELGVPPVGAIRAATHSAPVNLRLELQEVDVLDAIQPQAGEAPVDITDPLPVIEDAVRGDIGAAVAKMGITLLVISVGVGVGAALAFPGSRSPRRVLAGAGLAPLVIIALLLPAGLTYDADAFEHSPELVGQLGSARELMTRVGSLETRFGSVDSRVRVLSSKIAGLYSTALTGDIERSDGEVVLLHVSDLHLNTIGLALVRDLARDFDVDAVLDTGDITSFGFEPETAFLDLFDDFEMPYYLVAGNHDSFEVRATLAANDDVILLDDQVVDILGIKVLGVEDPTETALRKIPKDVINQTYRDQFASTTQQVEDEQPDLLMVHNPVQARPVYGKVPTVVAGHIHKTQLEIIDGTVISVVGSSGATGVGDMLADVDNPFEFQLLRYVDNRLVAVDQIKLQGAGGDFVLNRILIRDDMDDTADDLSDAGAYEPSLEEMQESDPDSVTTTTVDPGVLDAAPDETPTTAPGG